MSDREFDVVIFGASGYTGKLVAEYMHDQYGDDQSIKYAIAGRNTEKLLEVKKDLNLNEDITKKLHERAFIYEKKKRSAAI